MYSDKTIEDALAVLPHLIYVAQQRQTMTYKEVADKIGKHHRPTRLWLAYLRDEICIPKRLPLLTAIVVNQDSGLPGDSFLPEGTDHLSPEAYEAAFLEHRDRVFMETGWDNLLKELEISPIEKEATELDMEGYVYNDVMKRRGGGGEGEAHRQLKQYVAQNPARLGLYAQGEALIEFPFVSGDKCDVVFELGALGTAVIEVKNGERGELIKGIYQAIKYRALMEAQKGHGEPYVVQAILVAYDLPEDIVQFAEGFGIRPFQVKRSTVERFMVE